MREMKLHEKPKGGQWSEHRKDVGDHIASHGCNGECLEALEMGHCCPRHLQRNHRPIEEDEVVSEDDSTTNPFGGGVKEPWLTTTTPDAGNQHEDKFQSSMEGLC